MNGYIKSSVSFYKPLINILNQYNIFKQFLNEYLDNNFYKTLTIEDEHIKNHNSEYDTILLKIVIYIFFGFLIILFIPVILGFIPFKEIKLT